jgi:Cu2+-containing amine oxidase
MSESGFVVWPSSSSPIWQLSYVLGDSSQPEGIAIHGAKYKGRQVFYKASLPSLRVQYDKPPGGSACGPYKDPLHYDNADVQSNGKKVAIYTYLSGFLPVLALESYHRIGSYRLRQRWAFTLSGTVLPRLFSAGLQCNQNHRHHTYWRFDFDINDAANDALYEFNTTTPNIGYGPGWHKKLSETTRVKNPPTNRHWAIMDRSAGNGYFIVPGSDDGVADGFSSHDLWVMRYRGSEDREGNQGSASSDDLFTYLNGENTDGQDVVVWYCGHLAHQAHAGGDEWHHVGPRLDQFRW